MSTSRALSRHAALSIAALLLLQPSASATPVRKGRPAAAARITPNNSIIPLPLTPIVPVAQRLCAARTASGLGYTVLRAATGAKPAATDVATINYVGYLAATGAVFDQNMTAPLPVDQVIPGFSEGVRLAARGSILRLCIPAALGYGAKATGPIPANADLVFQIELLDFKPAGTGEGSTPPAGN